jgi:hypothetical protein
VSQQLEDDTAERGVEKVNGSRSPRNAERARRKVAELMARAGISEPGKKGDGTLTTEPILVFRGRSRSRLIFDQYGNEIGVVRRHRKACELRDRELRCSVRATKPPPRLEYEFSVAGADGQALGTINQDNVVPIGKLKRTRITSRGRTIAMLESPTRREVLSERVSASSWISRAHYLLDHFSWRRFSIADYYGHEAARITYVRPSILPFHVSYVLDFEPSTREPIRTMTLAACIVVHRRMIRPMLHPGQAGGGGAA